MISLKITGLILCVSLASVALAQAAGPGPKTAAPKTETPKAEAPKVEAQKMDAASDKEEPTPARPLTVVVWGDSIAAGQDGVTWPAIAERMCNVVLNTGRPVRVINASVGGMPAAAAKTQFAQKILPNAPDIVIIQFGFNDLRYDGTRGNLPLSTLAEFRTHLTGMVTQCRDEAHARVIVFGNHKAQVNLILPSGRTYDEARVDYSAVAKQVAAQNKAEYHDLALELKLEGASWTDLLSTDGVHLSPLGFNAYGRFAANVIAGTAK